MPVSILLAGGRWYSPVGSIFLTKQLLGIERESLSKRSVVNELPLGGKYIIMHMPAFANCCVDFFWYGTIVAIWQCVSSSASDILAHIEINVNKTTPINVCNIIRRFISSPLLLQHTSSKIAGYTHTVDALKDMRHTCHTTIP